MSAGSAGEAPADLLDRLFPAGRPPELGERAADLAVAAECALRGGARVRELYGREAVGLRRKSGGSPVTRADHAANAAILELLRARRPEDPVLSEESEAPPAGGGARLWVVDPLDGTKEFLARNGEFSIMVGLAVGGAAVLGAVYRPDPGVLYLGVVGRGAWRVASPRQAAPARALRVREDVPRPLRFARSRSHGDPTLDRLQQALGEVDVVRSGSVGIKCALIADGRADAYVHPVPYLKEWDTCAPEAVLRGAGGRVTDCSGRPLSYGKGRPEQPGGIFAATPPAWERMAPLVREVAPAPPGSGGATEGPADEGTES